MLKVEDHLCVLSNVLPKHRNLASSFIANVMHVMIVEKEDMEVQHIMLATEQRYKYMISYAKPWREK